MRFTLDARVAVAAINAVSAAVKPSQQIPILSNMMVQAAGGLVDITATNLDLQIRYQIPEARIDQEGAITVSADRFREIVNALPEGADFSFHLPDPLGRVELNAGRSRFKLAALPARDFPTLREPEAAESIGFTLKAGEFLRILQVGGSWPMTGKSQAHLQCTMLHGAAGALRAVSLDGKRLVTCELKDTPDADRLVNMKLPTSTANVLLPMLAREKEDATVTMDASPGLASFVVGRATLITKLLNPAPEYPEYSNFVPKSWPTRFTIDTDLFMGAVARCMTMIDQEKKRLTVTLRTGNLRLDAQSQHGDVFEDIEVDYEGEERRIHYNAFYLRDALAKIKTENTRVAISALDGSHGGYMTLQDTYDAPDSFMMVCRQAGSDA